MRRLVQDPRSLDRLAWGAVAVGALIRLLWILVVHPPYEHVFSDMQGYVERATHLAQGGALRPSDAFYPPLTHIMLAGAIKLFGGGSEGLRAGAVEWWALASLVPLFAWRLARRLLGPGPATLTAVLVALYPPFILYGGFFTSEIPALALLTGGLWLGYRALMGSGRVVASAAGAGVLGGMAAANRPQFLLNLAVVGLPILWRWRRQAPRALALAAGLCAVLVPVIVHNSVAMGSLTGLSANGGLNFFQSHCDVHLVTAGSPEHGGVFVFGSPVPYAQHSGRDYRFPDHQVWDQGFFLGRGMRCIRHDGLGHIGLLAGNLIDATATTPPWPLVNPGGGGGLARWSNLLYSLLLPVIVVATLLRLRRRWGGGELQLLLQLACVVPVLLVFDSEPRFRIPYDVFGLALLASLLWALAPELRSLAARFGRPPGRAPAAEAQPQ